MSLAFIDNLPFDILIVLGAGIVALLQWLLKKGERLRRQSIEAEESRFGGIEIEDTPPAERAPARAPIRPVPVLRVEVARPRPAPEPPPAAAPRRGARVAPREGRRPAAAAAHLARHLRRGRSGLREAILLREILGPPKALRHSPRRW